MSSTKKTSRPRRLFPAAFHERVIHSTARARRSRADHRHRRCPRPHRSPHAHGLRQEGRRPGRKRKRRPGRQRERSQSPRPAGDPGRGGPRPGGSDRELLHGDRDPRSRERSRDPRARDRHHRVARVRGGRHRARRATRSSRSKPASTSFGSSRRRRTSRAFSTATTA